MVTVVIYATIMLNNIVSVVEYKGEVFKNNEECILSLIHISEPTRPY